MSIYENYPPADLRWLNQLDPQERTVDNNLDYLDYYEGDMIWKLTEAKNKLSEVVRRALDGEPQRIERRDDAVVVVDAGEFDRLTGGSHGLADFLVNAPDLSELDLERDRSPMRDLEL